jgi:prevent-host-death family protein
VSVVLRSVPPQYTPAVWLGATVVGMLLDLVQTLVHNGNMAVNIHEAKTTFSKLLQRVAAGEEIIIAKAGVPVARLVPIHREQPKRPLGLYRDQIWIADDFDAPLPSKILAGFLGEDLPAQKPARPATAKRRKRA